MRMVKTVGLLSLAGAVVVAGACRSQSPAGGAEASGQGSVDQASSAEPQILLADGHRLAEARQRVRDQDPSVQRAYQALIRMADEALEAPMLSVTDKPSVPEGASPNDYVSLSPYWWPNPETDDGLPYVRRDGEINPERDQYDMPVLDMFGQSVRWLGFAYYFSGDERYAEAAVQRIEHFLIDPATRMTPRMKYGQFVPGVSDGRKYGIIETLRLRWVPDAINLLRESPAMSDEVYEGARQWFGDYAQWLNTSELGVAERDGPNNHGTWATAQIAYYAAFAGDQQTVREMAALVPDRIEAQFEDDGGQPEELARTRAMDYSEFNLRGLTELAVLAQDVGVDLWNTETESGRSIRLGYDFMLPYMLGEEDWPYQQISQPKHDFYAQSLRRCAIAYNDPRFERAIKALDHLGDEGRIYLDLLIPLPRPFPAPR